MTKEATFREADKDTIIQEKVKKKKSCVSFNKGVCGDEEWQRMVEEREKNVHQSVFTLQNPILPLNRLRT